MYGLTTISDIFGDGITEYDDIIWSGKTSLSSCKRSDPKPDPVPPPKEWVNWKAWRQSQDSASFLIISKTDCKISLPMP